MLFLPAIFHHNTIVGRVEFLLDTGSPFTVLSPREGLRFRYPLKQLSKLPSAACQLAGFKFKRHSLGVGVTLTVTDNKMNPVLIKYDSVGLLSPTKFDDINLEECEKIPSIIGVDFLEAKDATLVFNPKRKIAYLDLP